MPTLTDLYRHYTGDRKTHQRTIGAAYARLASTTPRRARIVCAYMAGQSMSTIGEREGISKASAQSVIEAAMRWIRRQVAREPRYKVPRTRRTR